MSFVVVRVRSGIKVRHDIKETMQYLNLTRVNHATIVPKNDTTIGMLKKAKDYITWGHADEGTLTTLLGERGRLIGNKPLNDTVVKENSAYDSIASLASALAKGEDTIKAVEGLKPVLRLHPPRGSKGWGGIKRHYSIGGALGHRKDGIDPLIERMV